MKGIFSVYKLKGPTSNDVVQAVKKITQEKKVGHAGTLDPLAKGVLVVAVGREFTKKLATIVKKEKEYLAKIKLGASTATDDAEAPEEKKFFKTKPKLVDIRKTIKNFIGHIEQIPPIYSAVKVKGKEAYKFARAGELTILAPRKVKIKSIKILKYKWPYLDLKVVTGPGVYIRSLARDLGQQLKTGGYLKSLERTRVGQFTKEKSLTLKQFSKLLYQSGRSSKMVE